MVHERDEKYEGQEDGEYHFSDDQANYDLEGDASKGAPSSAVDARDKLLEKFNRYRRPIIALSVFFILIFIVFKILSPSTPETATEISAAPAPVTKPSVKVPETTTAANTANIPAQITAAIAPPREQPTMLPSEMPNAAVTAAQSQQPPVTVVPEANGLPQGKGMPERVAILEEQNAKMINFLQTEYGQRLAEFQAQNDATQQKLQDLNTRISGIETSLNQLNQLLQSVSSSNKPPNSSAMQSSSEKTYYYRPRPSVASGPRITYTVQAIIPGRAWLKSESGDTVTVAEGDALKGYGRIAKIDPYDGVVLIDTGTRTISLSYGVNGD